MKYALIALPFLSLFFFPPVVTIVFALVASFLFVPTVLLVGVLFDLLYGTTAGVYAGTLSGVLAIFVILLLRKFLKQHTTLL